MFRNFFIFQESLTLLENVYTLSRNLLEISKKKSRTNLECFYKLSRNFEKPLQMSKTISKKLETVVDISGKVQQGQVGDSRKCLTIGSTRTGVETETNKYK